MKRDLDLIRKLVLAIEDNPTGFVTDDVHIDGYSEEQIGYHSYAMTPNRCIDRSAQQRCCWVPVALRAPAPGHAGRSAS